MKLVLQGSLSDCLEHSSMPIIALASELDVSHLELGEDCNIDERQLQDIKNRLDATGIGVVSMHVRTPRQTANGSGSDPLAFDDAIRTLDRASFLGARMMTFVNSPPVLGTSVDVERKRFEQVVAYLIPKVLERGLVPTFNNSGGMAKYYGQANYLLQLCREFAPHTRMTFDVGNWMLAGESVHQAVDLFRNQIEMVHFKDWVVLSQSGSVASALRHAFQKIVRGVKQSGLAPTARRLSRSVRTLRHATANVCGIDGTWYTGAVVGEGILDHSAIVTHLRQIGFNGYVTVEYEGPSDPVDSLRRGVRNTRRLWESSDLPACPTELEA